jgi:hypothetical protein
MTDWKILNQIARSYLDLQKTRVAMDLRCQKLEEQELIKNGLAKEQITIETDDVTGAEIRSRKVIPLKGDTKDEQKRIDKQIKDTLEKFREENESYKLLLSHNNRLHKQEKDLLKESTQIFRVSKLWKWCESVRGLGPVAGMTFVGYINPEIAKTVANMWSYLGLTPNQLRRKGQQSNFNPQLKGRFLGVICQNLIRSNDPYYSGIYRIKKDYYRERPDLIAAKKKGFNAHTDKMAKRIMAKLIVSHAFELLQDDRGMPIEPIANSHRNPIPIKPDDMDEQKRVLERYTKNHAVLIEKLKGLWVNGDAETEEQQKERKERYWEFLKHADFS